MSDRTKLLNARSWASRSFIRFSRSSLIQSLHQVVGASDGRGHPGGIQEVCGRGGDGLRTPAATGVREPTSPRVLPKLRAGWQRLKAGHDRLNDSPLGDVLGGLCLIVTALIILIFFLAA